MLAGVPMMNGASTLEGYVPNIDATVVTRILDAGGTIVGKAHCEYFCLSGGSHTSAAGPVHNPRRMGYSAGGSSSGSAALVAAGEADMALGGDQGGSIRMPASFCGIYGMKPTHGLVPYTGIMPIEIFVDHTGPMTANVADNALLLEVLAGPDGYDPRQYDVRVHPYTEALGKGVGGLRIGVVTEGFRQANAEEDVDAKVRTAAERLARLGATVAEVSIPMHLLGPAIWTPIGTEGLTQTMMWGDGYGVSRPDLYVTSLMDFHRNWRTRANELSETTKAFTLLGTYIRRQHGSRYYGKAVNIVRRLRAAYDAALAQHDLLLMPTTPIKATRLPGPDASREEIVEKALNMISNTAPFDLTHHPAMAVPCGMSDGLPLSMMLIGRHFDEPTIYRAAHAFEQSGDWTTM
jgi:amidase